MKSFKPQKESCDRLFSSKNCLYKSVIFALCLAERKEEEKEEKDQC